MSRPNDHDDTPVAQCESFWMAQQSVQGISRVDRRNTAIDRCAMQRGYGTVALQFDIDIATNERLAAEAASNCTAMSHSFILFLT
jgi:hypothetical protein